MSFSSLAYVFARLLQINQSHLSRGWIRVKASPHQLCSLKRVDTVASSIEAAPVACCRLVLSGSRRWSCKDGSVCARRVVQSTLYVCVVAPEPSRQGGPWEVTVAQCACACVCACVRCAVWPHMQRGQRRGGPRMCNNNNGHIAPAACTARCRGVGQGCFASEQTPRVLRPQGSGVTTATHPLARDDDDDDQQH